MTALFSDSLLGGQLCLGGYSLLQSRQVTEFEEFLDRLNQALEPVKGDDDPGLALAVQYLNGLSNLHFVMARTLNRADGRREILWQRHRHG